MKQNGERGVTYLLATRVPLDTSSASYSPLNEDRLRQ